MHKMKILKNILNWFALICGAKDEKLAVQKAADDMGVSMSAFARMVIKDFMKKSSN
jgi:hypothetical protein